MIDNDPHAVNICLYVAIPEWDEGRRHIRPWRQRLKSFAKHSLDRLATRFSGHLHLDLFHYAALRGLGNNSNRGDIAIRMAIKQQLTTAFAPRRVCFSDVKWGELTDDVAQEVNRHSDIFVIGGGGYIFLGPDGAAGEMLAAVEELDKIRLPVFAYGIGLNRLMHEKICDLHDLPEASRQKVRYLANRCTLVSVRDFDTAQLFQLCSDKPAALTGDPVLFYLPRNRQPARPAENRRPVIGINLASHGWRTLSVLKPLLPTILAFLKWIQRTHQAEFVYLQHHDFERPVIDFLRARGLRFRLVCSSPDELLEGYATTDFVICQMLHACIFSANAGVPFLNIAYDEKSVAFCKLLAIQECCVRHTDARLTVLEDAFSSLFQKRSQLAGTLDRRKKDLLVSSTIFAGQMAAETERLTSAP